MDLHLGPLDLMAMLDPPVPSPRRMLLLQLVCLLGWGDKESTQTTHRVCSAVIMLQNMIWTRKIRGCVIDILSTMEIAHTLLAVMERVADRPAMAQTIWDRQLDEARHQELAPVDQIAPEMTDMTRCPSLDGVLRQGINMFHEILAEVDHIALGMTEMRCYR